MELGWLTVKESIETEINKEAPNFLITLFERLSDISIRELLNTSRELKLPCLRTSSGQRCIGYIGAELWNNQSVEVKTATTLSRF